MESKEQNYGISGEPEAAEPQAAREPEREPVGPYVMVEDDAGQDRADYGAVGMGAREEKTWSVLAHLSGFLNVFTLFLGPVAALIVWLVYRDRSPRVAFEALQSAAYQGAWLAILGIGWAVTIALTFVLVGFLLIPAMLILTVVPFAHMGYAAYKVGKDGHYRYPVVADLVENR
jgi:uncharacterized Tic20 family protein